jgi:retron-type reverse transcriptase
MAFSGPVKPRLDLQVQLTQILDRYGFRLNHDKTRISGPGEQHKLLGLVVNTKVHPDRSTRRILRAKFHNLEKGIAPEGETQSQLEGWASYVNSYDGALGREYLGLAKMRN